MRRPDGRHRLGEAAPNFTGYANRSRQRIQSDRTSLVFGPAPADPAVRDTARLPQENQRRATELERAKAVTEVPGKLSTLLDTPATAVNGNAQ